MGQLTHKHNLHVIDKTNNKIIIKFDRKTNKICLLFSISLYPLHEMKHNFIFPNMPYMHYDMQMFFFFLLMKSTQSVRLMLPQIYIFYLNYEQSLYFIYSVVFFPFQNYFSIIFPSDFLSCSLYLDSVCLLQINWYSTTLPKFLCERG